MQAMNEKVTRRRMSLLLAGLGVASAQAETTKTGATIHQEADFNAAPVRIYAALLDAKQFAAFSKDTAEIQPQAGGSFRLFGGRIEGRNIELVPDRRIIQAWRPANWPPGVYSIARFELMARGSQTRIVFEQAGFTAEKWETLSAGWHSHYWEPLRKYLSA
jgi:activator of HSP90 ATPase